MSTAITTGEHILSITAGVRSLAPVNGWAMHEADGEARMECTCHVVVCGPIAHVKALADHHMRDVAQP
jgi:hypothetical protein